MRIRLLLFLLVVTFASPVFAQDASQINVGDVVAGAITNEVSQARYTFEGSAGDALVISMRATSDNLDSYVEVYTPDGARLFNDDRAGSLDSLLPLILPANGAYTLVATRCCAGAQGQSTGTYELAVERATMTPVVVGEPMTVSVDESHPYAFLSFTGATASVVSLHAERVAGDAAFDIGVRSPAGAIVNNASQTDDGTVTLDPLLVNVDGSYILVVSRRSAPDAAPAGSSVEVRLTMQAVAAQAIAMGETVSGVLDDAHPADYYLFSASADDLIRLVGSQSEDSQTYEILVYTQQGSVFYGVSTANPPTPGSFVLDPLQIIETGEYLLYVHRLDAYGAGEVGTSRYTFTLSPSELPRLELGVAVTASFDGSTYEHVYRFMGSAGQAIRITLRSESSDYAPGLSVQGPPVPEMQNPAGGAYSFYLNVSGNIAATLYYDVTLPADGEYLFRVNNATLGQIGLESATFSLIVEATS